MKSVLISIKPKYCELIVSGQKTMEVRKTKPRIDTPFKCYIYCTKDKSKNLQLQGKVIGEFVCDEIFPIRVFENGTIQDYMFRGMKKSCVPYDDIVNYIGNGCIGYGWHISNLVIYQEPNEIILERCEERPIKTRQDKFLEIFPNAKIDNCGTSILCPQWVDKDFKCNLQTLGCAKCCKEYWLAEVAENE